MLLKCFAPLNVGWSCANPDSVMQYCMTNHFFTLVNENTIVVKIKCFAPLHGHVQMALLYG